MTVHERWDWITEEIRQAYAWLEAIETGEWPRGRHDASRQVMALQRVIHKFKERRQALCYEIVRGHYV